MDINPEIKALDLVMSRINGMNFRWAQEHELNAYTAKVLYALADGNEMTQKRICEVCGMPKQTVNNVIRTLYRDGMAVLKPQESDRREKAVSLTEKGQEYLQETLAPLVELETRILRRMGREKYELMLEALTEYSKAMEKEMYHN